MGNKISVIIAEMLHVRLIPEGSISMEDLAVNA